MDKEENTDGIKCCDKVRHTHNNEREFVENVVRTRYG